MLIELDTKARTVYIWTDAAKMNNEGDIIKWRKTKTGQPFPIKKGQTVKEALTEFIEAKEKVEDPEENLVIPVKVGIINCDGIKYLEVDNKTIRRIFKYIDSDLKEKRLPERYIHPALLEDGIYLLELYPKDNYYNFKIADIREYDND